MGYSSTTIAEDQVAPQGLRGVDIVCFAKEWKEDPTSCNHVLKELARHNRVLWVNSISTRSPNLASGRDLAKIFRKLWAFLGGFFRGAEQVGENMWLFNPIVLPLHNREWAVRLNRRLLRFTLGLQRRRLGMGRFQLWTFVHTACDYVGTLGEDLVVYYCTDDWASFGFADARRVGDMVNTLATRADVVFATSRPLVDKLKPLNQHTYLASHGVDYELFARALSNDTEVPADIAALPHPVIGFFGLVEEWMDQALIAHLARSHPEWSIALIGKVNVDVSQLSGLPNIHFLGRKPHDDLPRYCKAFDVALIPHQITELTRHMNPIKLREYISAGLPIVSVDLPEMRHFPDACTIAPDHAAFEAAVVAALAGDSPERRQERSQSMRQETWPHKVVAIGQTVAKVKAEREASRHV